MKLHLPKSLLTAVLAIGLATGSTAYGLTVTTSTTDAIINTAQDSTGNAYSYDAETGVITFNYDFSKFEATFTLDYDRFKALTENKALLYITRENDKSWGLSANTNGVIKGKDQTNLEYNNQVTQPSLSTYVTGEGENQVIENLYALIDATNSNSNGTQLKTAATNGTEIYKNTGLKYTGATATVETATLDTSLISSITIKDANEVTVTNAAGNWTKTYQFKGVAKNTIATSAVDATILNNGSQKVGYESNAQAGANGLAQAGDIIIGGSGQLYLQTYGGDNNVKTGNDITVSNTIYLGTSTQTTGGLRLAAYSGNILLNGNITLIEDAKITKEHNKKSATETPNTVTFAGTVSGDYTLTVAADQGDNKFEYVAFNNTVDIKGLSLGSNAEISFNGTTSIDTLSMNSHSLALSGSGNVTLGGGTLTDTIDNTNANLTMSGSWTADSLSIFDNNINAESGYSDGANGYLKNDAVFTIVDNSESGAVTFSGTLTAGGVAREVTTQNGDAVVTLAADNTNYYVNTTVDYAEGSNVANASSIVMNGGTLNLNKVLADEVNISTISTGSSINIAAGVTLDNSAVATVGTKSSITGAAATETSAASVYNMGQVSLTGTATGAPNVILDSGWQGTVVFAAGSKFKSEKLDLNAFGVAGSTIQFNGTTTDGYLGNAVAGEGHRYVANIELKSGDFHVSDGWGGSKFTFAGDFKGNGGFTVTKGTLQNGLTFTFAGDMSQWYGALTHTNGENNTYKYAAADGKSTTIANQIKATGGTMKVTVDNDDDEGVSMTGAIVAAGGELRLTKTGGSTLSVTNMAAQTSNIVLTGAGENDIEIGTLSIATGMTVTGTADVTVNTKLAVASENAFTLTGALALGDDVSIDLAGLELQANQLSYTLGTASAGITGSIAVEQIKNLNLGETYKDYTYSITAVDLTAASGIALLAEGGNTNTALVLTLEAATTTLTSLTVTGVDTDRSTNTVLTLTTAENAANAVFGTDLNAVMSDAKWEDIKAALAGEGITLSDEIAITFVGADGTTFDFNGANDDLTAPTITINGEGTQDAQVLSGTPNGTKVGNYVTAYIPEPTSTTLSLLALAALAVRRCRK